jgi:transcriptional regulator with XRE-family HTH domain
MQKKKPSQLALKRTQMGLEQKQIASLLGQKTIHQYSRLENGERVASLKDAVKLSLIFRLPISTLFDDIFQKCQEDLRKQLKNSPLSEVIKLESIEQCSYLEMMSSKYVSLENADKIRRHLKVLVEERSKKILGN